MALKLSGKAQAGYDALDNQIRVQIKNLKPAYDAPDDSYFVLSGVKQFDVDYPSITRILSDSGMSQVDAEHYVEEFAQLLWTREIAKVLANQITIV